jgi:hypothetical protein
MGYVFAKVSDLDVRLPPTSHFFFLKASDTSLGPFYNEHRNRSALHGPVQNAINGSRCLDRNLEAIFDDGWYEPTILPPVARRMGKQGRIRFYATALSAISLDLTTGIPDLPKQPLKLDLFLNGVNLCSLSLFRYGWLEVRIVVPPAFVSPANGEFELQLIADRTSQRNQLSQGERDNREVSIAVCNVAVHQ